MSSLCSSASTRRSGSCSARANGPTAPRRRKETVPRFGQVERADGDARREAFHRLVRLLSVHETAEEELVHPEVRHQDGGRPVVEARLDEERRAKDLLSTMDGMGPD